MNLAERLKSERDRLGLSQTEFAAHASASKHSQINWEKGAATPNAAALEAWAKIGVDVLYVLTGKHADGSTPAPAPRLTPAQAALLDNYAACSPADQDAIRRLAATAAQPPARVIRAASKRK